MGTTLGPKYIPYTYMDPLGLRLSIGGGREVQVPKAVRCRIPAYSLLGSPSPWQLYLEVHGT